MERTPKIRELYDNRSTIRIVGHTSIPKEFSITLTSAAIRAIAKKAPKDGYVCIEVGDKYSIRVWRKNEVEERK